MVQLFLNSGMMNQCLLEDVIRESEFSFEIAVEVLKVSHIICGPVNKTSYIAPYFSPKVITVTETGSYVPSKVEWAFNGLSVPGYVNPMLAAVMWIVRFLSSIT